MVITAGIVGGIVGGILSHKKNTGNNNPQSVVVTSSTSAAARSSTSSATTSSTSINPQQTSGIVALNCPDMNNTQYQVQSGTLTYTFLRYCQLNVGGTSPVIQRSIQLSYEACINRCVTQQSPDCVGITFDANLTSYVPPGGNCFIFSRIDGWFPYTVDFSQASAQLISKQ